ncbi:hypothetical protein C8R45DRAFT_929741 [Mycena sanguinolenta]|nr:hypothetical protein C8R45DRAFT_929741 [Mycena sanguinolenta]
MSPGLETGRNRRARQERQIQGITTYVDGERWGTVSTNLCQGKNSHASPDSANNWRAIGRATPRDGGVDASRESLQIETDPWAFQRVSVKSTIPAVHASRPCRGPIALEVWLLQTNRTRKELRVSGGQEIALKKLDSAKWTMHDFIVQASQTKGGGMGDSENIKVRSKCRLPDWGVLRLRFWFAGGTGFSPWHGVPWRGSVAVLACKACKRAVDLNF